MKLAFCLLSCFFILSCGANTCPPAPPPLNGGLIIRNGAESYWDSSDFPIKVYIDETLDQSVIDDVIQATDLWNYYTGGPAFIVEVRSFYTEPESVCGWIAVMEADIQASPYDRPENWDAFFAGEMYSGTSRFCAGSILLDTELPHDWTYWVAIHELGHGLGLAHDMGDMRSIMYPSVRGVEINQYIMPDDSYVVSLMIYGRFRPEVSSDENSMHSLEF